MNPSEVYDETTDSSSRPAVVCAIGASAGGLAPLEEFFDHIPSDSGMAFVVVQHLSPDHDSLMAHLLGSHTEMPVAQAIDGQRVVADHVYLIPPGREITIGGRALHVRRRETGGVEPHRPIDVFFGSMADDAGPDCIAVVLSGTGSDGAVGIERVRRRGGLALAQDETADFDGMPNAARRTGFVDASLAPRDLAAACVAYSTARVRPDGEGGTVRPVQPAVAEIIAHLQSRSGLSFSEYKPGTLRRRIERRIQLDAGGDTQGYLARLRSDPDLADELVQDVLIDVTEFFRDQEAFDVLERHVLPRLVREAADSGSPIRVWVPGCATGAEAYSIAMLLDEAVESANMAEVPIRVFATDVHVGSLETAAAGFYTPAALGGLSEARLERFFDETSGGWRVKPVLRDLVTFAEHDLLADAPFTKVDLVTFRNVLIYFQSGAQGRALRAVDFALRPGGVLVLGSSESLGPIDVDFEPVSESWRVFRKRLDAGSVLVGGSARTRVPPRARSVAVDQRLIRVYDALLDAHFVSGLVVNDRRELVHTIGAASDWIGQPRGRTTLDVLALVRDQTLRLSIGAVLRELESGAPRTEPRLVSVPSHGGRVTVLSGEVVNVGTTSYYLVHAAPHDDPAGSPAAPPVRPQITVEQTGEYVQQLEAELSYTRESLQAALDEQDVSNEELHASNEELVASNEELQSTNEELSSVNEELRTLNDEHRSRLEELHELSADLEHLMSAIEVGVIFLAEDGTIRRFNEPARDYFRVRNGDVGRPFGDITITIEGIDLASAIAEVAAGGRPRSARATSQLDPNARLMVRVDRYELPRNRSGVFVAVFDVSEVMVAQEERALATMMQHAPLITVMWTDDNRVAYRNRSLVTGSLPVTYRTDDPVEPAPQVLTPAVAEALEAARAEDRPQFRMDRFDTGGSDGATPTWEEYIFVVHPFEFAERRLVGAMAFPVDQLVELTELRVQSVIFDAMARHSRLRANVLDKEGRPIRRAGSGAVMESPEEIEAVFRDRADDPDQTLEAYRRAVLSGEELTEVNVGRRPDGSAFRFESRVVPTPDSLTVGGVAISVEVTDFVEQAAEQERRLEEARNEIARLRAELSRTRQSGEEWALDLAERNADLDNFAHVAAHDLKAPIRSVRSFAELAASEIPDDSPAHRRLDRVLEATDRMTSLVESLLDFASIDRRRPESDAVDIRSVVDDLVVDLEEAISSRGASIDVDVPDGTEVRGDETGIRQVLGNLVQNSIKYSEQAPRIRISTRRLDEGTVIDVVDQGIGFDQEMAERVFEPFKRLHDMSVSGNGVGLAICRRIVERQGGRVWAVSERGVGSTFSVWLPDRAGDES